MPKDKKGEKKEELTFQQRLDLRLSKTSIVLPRDDEVLADMIIDVYKAYKRNEIGEPLIKARLAMDNKNVEITNSLGMIQKEMREQEALIDFLLLRLK